MQPQEITVANRVAFDPDGFRRALHEIAAEAPPDLARARQRFAAHEQRARADIRDRRKRERLNRAKGRLQRRKGK